MGLRRVYLDERAIPVRTNLNGYSVQQWHNPDEDVTLVMATFPVTNNRISLEGQAPIFNLTAGKPEMVPVMLGQFHDRRGFAQDDLTTEPYPVDLWERPLWLVYLAWLTVLGAACLALILLVAWLRLR